LEQFDEYGFPAAYPPGVLAEMRGKLPRKGKAFRQLHLLFDAACNLYALISLEKLFDLCRLYLPRISQEGFLAAVEIIAHENRNYYAIVRKEIFHEELGPGGPMDRELVAEHLYAVGDEYYYAMEKDHEGKPWYTPPWEEYVKYADGWYTEDTPQQQYLIRFLRNTQQDLICPAEEILDEIVLHLRMDAKLQDIIDDAQRFGVRFETPEDFRSFLRLLLKLNRHTRRYSLRGHTPAELGLPTETVETALKQVSYDNDYEDPLEKAAKLFTSIATTSGKPARNAPCPCGSGRKYKNCCGK